MSKDTRPVVTYYFRGQIERGNGRGGYVWKDGYSENSPDGRVIFGWNTYRECQAAAKAAGCKAKFVK